MGYRYADDVQREMERLKDASDNLDEDNIEALVDIIETKIKE